MLINTNICVLPRVLHFLKVNRFFIVLKGLTVLLCLDLIKKGVYNIVDITHYHPSFLFFIEICILNYHDSDVLM